MLFEKTDPKAKCTHDSDKNPGCGVFLKSKLEGGGEPKKEKRERKAKDSKKDDSKKDDSKKDDSKN
ncbi:hypothetical protein HY251_08115 [bacterium]|nr:hypothetical protein [bacterium]